MPDDLALSGLTAHIDPPDNSYGGMDILILGDLIRVDAGDLSWESFHEVSRETTGTSFDDWLNNRPPPRVLAVGWGAFPDSDLGVVYLYDKTDGNFSRSTTSTATAAFTARKKASVLGIRSTDDFAIRTIPRTGGYKCCASTATWQRTSTGYVPTGRPMCSDQTNSGRLDPRKGYWSMTTPCNNCPFRNDKPPFGLRPGRVREIAVALERTTFTCHKTTVHNDDDDDPGMIDGPNARHCAGALILMEKLGREGMQGRRLRTERVCVREGCENVFRPWRSSSRFCSTTCANKAHAGERTKDNRRTCVDCGAETNPSQMARSRVGRDSEEGRHSIYLARCISCQVSYNKQRRNELPWWHARVPYLIANARARARARGLEFAITRDDIDIPDVCPVLGIPFSREIEDDARYFAQSMSPSIDRIDNSRGYTPDNIVVVSCRANSIKGDASVEELEAVATFYRDLRKNPPQQGGSSSQMMRIAERLGLYDPKRLDLDAPVYDDWEAAAAAQEEI
jgi:hypothetical protein